MIEDLKCPISREIFLNPVVASDGFIYEKECIKKWLVNHSNSPMTNEDIEKFYCKSNQKIQEVKEFLRLNPEYLNDQYKSEIFDQKKIIQILRINCQHNRRKYRCIELN